MECSESFYRDCVTEDMGSRNRLDDDSKRKMMNILTKLHHQNAEEGFENPEKLMQYLEDNYEDSGSDAGTTDAQIDPNELLDWQEDSDDDYDVLDLKDRLENVDLEDSEAVWKVLTDDERNEFEAIVSNGDVSKLLPAWDPWWLYRKESKLVELVNKSDESDPEKEHLKQCPPILANTAELASLSKSKPADCLQFNIVNLLAAYTFVLRYLNGDNKTYEAVCYLMHICSVIKDGKNFEDSAVAIESIIQECINSVVIATDKENTEMIKSDLRRLILGPSTANQTHYIKCALSDVYEMLAQGKKELKTNTKSEEDESNKNSEDFAKRFPKHGTEHLPQVNANDMKLAMKKIEFYLSYVNSYGLSMELLI